PEVEPTLRQEKELLEDDKPTEAVEVFQVIVDYGLLEELDVEERNTLYWSSEFEDDKEWDKKMLEIYFQQRRQHEKLVEQLNVEFYSDTTWAYQDEYLNIEGYEVNSEDASMDIDKEYLINSPK
ncbi:12783_t:CDS:1, partial [Ambispora leptoticha]